MSSSQFMIIDGTKYSFRVDALKSSTAQASSIRVVCIRFYKYEEEGGSTKRVAWGCKNTSGTEDEIKETAETYIRDKHAASRLQNSQIPTSYKSCSFQEYVSDFNRFYTLSRLYKWKDSENSTESAYRSALQNQWANAFDNTIPFYQITKQHCEEAMQRIKSKQGQQTSDAREEWLYNVLRHVMEFAAVCKDRKDNPVPKSLNRKENWKASTTKGIKARRLTSHTLTCDQMLSLFKRIKSCYEEDGAWLAIGRMLFCGVRTSEACGGIFGDFIKLDHYEDEYCIRVVRQQRKADVPADLDLKTRNAYRNTPIVSAFAELILNKKKIVEGSLTNGENVDDLPIACRATDYHKPCTPAHVNHLLKEWIHDTKDDSIADSLSFENKIDDILDESIKKTAYTLRRNAYTLMMSLAGMSESEASYLIGHSEDTNKWNPSLKKYRDYSSEDRQHELLCKLNGILYCLGLYQGEHVILPSESCMISRKEQVDLTIEGELSNNEKVELIARAYEVNDPIVIEVQTSAEITLEKAKSVYAQQSMRNVVIISGMKQQMSEANQFEHDSRYTKKAKRISTEESMVSIAPSDFHLIPDNSKMPHEQSCSSECPKQEDMVSNSEKHLVVITKSGYANRIPLCNIGILNRGANGHYIIRTDEEDPVSAAAIVSSNGRILIVDIHGDAVITDAKGIEQCSLNTKGRMVVQTSSSQKISEVLGIGTAIASILAIPDGTEQDITTSFLMIVTSKGFVKKLEWNKLDALLNGSESKICLLSAGNVGTIANVFVLNAPTNKKQNIMLLSKKGYACIFPMFEVESSRLFDDGRLGMRLEDDDSCVDAREYSRQNVFATISRKGYGKLSKAEKLIFNKKNQIGSSGSIVQHIKKKEPEDSVCKCCPIELDTNDIIVISTLGKCIRIFASLPIQQLNTEGYRIQRMRCGSNGKFEKQNHVSCLLQCKHET